MHVLAMRATLWWIKEIAQAVVILPALAVILLAVALAELSERLVDLVRRTFL